MHKIPKWLLCLICVLMVGALSLGVNAIKTYIGPVYSGNNTLEEAFQRNTNGNVTIIDSIVDDNVAYVIGCKKAEVVDRCFYINGKNWYAVNSPNTLLVNTNVGPIDIFCRKVDDKYIISIMQFPTEESFDLAEDSIQSDFHFTKYRLATEEVRYVVAQSIVLQDLPENYNILFKGENIQIN